MKNCPSKFWTFRIHPNKKMLIQYLKTEFQYDDISCNVSITDIVWMCDDVDMSQTLAQILMILICHRHCQNTWYYMSHRLSEYLMIIVCLTK